MTWIGQPYPIRFAFKKDIPREHRANARQVNTTFERVWIVLNHNREVLTSAGWMPTFDAYLTTPGHVIGAQDTQAPGNLPWAHEWRQALADWREDQIKLRLASNPKG